MKSTTRFALIALVFVLPSCNSFNHYEINTRAATETPASKKVKDTALATASLTDEQIHSNEPNSPLAPDMSAPKKPAVTASCPVYHLPDLGTAPDLPYDQLDMLRKSGNMSAFDKAAEDQIVALYQYIRTLKKNIRDSHQQYLKDCQNYLNSQTSNQNSLGQ